MQKPTRPEPTTPYADWKQMHPKGCLAEYYRAMRQEDPYWTMEFDQYLEEYLTYCLLHGIRLAMIRDKETGTIAAELHSDSIPALLEADTDLPVDSRYELVPVYRPMTVLEDFRFEVYGDDSNCRLVLAV